MPSASVRIGRPENTDRSGVSFVGANVYLYRIEPNAALRNADLATRDPSGALIARPCAAIDLYYLISFYGNDLQLETQRMLGKTVALLHGQPLLTRDRIRQAIDHNTASANPYLAGSDLDQQVEAIRLTSVVLSLEELSKLWTVFFQVTHALSVSYLASVLLLETDGPIERALPVQRVGTVPRPGLPPRLTGVSPSPVEFSPSAEVTLLGENLEGGSTVARIGGTEVATQVGPNGGLVARLPAGVLAGVNDVRLVRYLTTTPTATLPTESNALNLVVQPSLANSFSVASLADPRDPTNSLTTLTIDPQPEPAPMQRLELLLNELAGPGLVPKIYSFVDLLRFTIPGQARDDLDQGRLTSALTAMFLAAGITLTPGVIITSVRPSVEWRIDDPAVGQKYRLVAWPDQIVVYYGLSGTGRCAFRVDGVAGGQYLVRVLVDQVQYAESRLLVGPDGRYSGPTVTFDQDVP